MIQGHRHDPFVAFADVLQGLGQGVGVEHVGFDDIDERASRRQQSSRPGDVLDDLGHEDVLVAGHDETEAMAATASQLRRRRVGLKSEAFDGFLDAADRRFPHAGAAVENPIDGGRGNPRLPGDVLQRDGGGIE